MVGESGAGRLLAKRLCLAVAALVFGASFLEHPAWQSPSLLTPSSAPGAVQSISLQQQMWPQENEQPGAVQLQEEDLITTSGGSYFGEQLQMDGVLRPLDGGSRIDAIMPPVYGASHASNLLELPDGTLLLVWFSNGVEGGDGVGIVASRLLPGAEKWTVPQMASQERGRSAQNPVTFYDARDGIVRLLHTSQVAFEGQGTSEVRIVESTDNGATWGAAKTLFKEAGAFVKNQMLMSENGDEWLLPMYYTPTGFLGHDTQYSTVQRSSDSGRTWREFVMEGTLGRCVQPTVVRLKTGKLRAWFRSRDADFIYTSDSTDDGVTWSRPLKTILPNNNSGIQAACLQSGAIVILFNNLQGPFARYPLTLGLSVDEGNTWPYMRDLEPMSSAQDGKRDSQKQSTDFQPDEDDGEYSYPSVIQSRDGYIHISYTFRRESIRYAKVTEDWVRKGFTIGQYKGALRG